MFRGEFSGWVAGSGRGEKPVASKGRKSSCAVTRGRIRNADMKLKIGRPEEGGGGEEGGADKRRCRRAM